MTTLLSALFLLVYFIVGTIIITLIGSMILMPIFEKLITFSDNKERKK